MKQKIILWFKRLSFRTGLTILFLCIPFYILSFAQMALDISYSLKGILWVVFFGLAKTFQYAGLTIIGVDGIKKLKSWWKKDKNKSKQIEEDVEVRIENSIEPD